MRVIVKPAEWKIPLHLWLPGRLVFSARLLRFCGRYSAEMQRLAPHAAALGKALYAYRKACGSFVLADITAADGTCVFVKV